MSDGAGATAGRAVLTSPAHAGMEAAAERKARLKALRAARDDKVGGEKKLKYSTMRWRVLLRPYERLLKRRSGQPVRRTRPESS